MTPTPTLFALRLGRWGIAGFSLAAFVQVFVNTIGFYQVAGSTAAARATFGASMTALASQFVAIFPPPLRPDTAAGYMQFRGFDPLAILFSVWALAAATGFARGDEERGVVESVLATGLTRPGLIASRVVAFGLGLTVASAAAGAGLAAGLATGHDSVPAGRLVEACVLLAAVGLAAYAIALLVAQIPAARIATASAAVVLLALFLVNSLSRELTWLSTWRWLSPFRYYELSQPLPPGGYFDARALAVLLGIALAASAAAAVAFSWRDLGSGLYRLPSRSRPPARRPAPLPLWGIAVLRGVYERRIGLVAWAAGVAILAVLFVSLTRTIVHVLLSLPGLAVYLSAYVRDRVYPAVLGVTWFTFAELLFAGLAIAYVARWAAEDVDGRLEISLAQPVSRAAVVVERLAVLVAVAALVAACSAVALGVASHAEGIDLDAARVAAASLLLVPFALVFAAAGMLLTSWKPRAAVGLLGAFTLASYLDADLATVFKLPTWLQDLSAFKLFGTPLVSGVDGRSLALMLLLAAVGVGSSILAMQRRDVGA